MPVVSPTQLTDQQVKDFQVIYKRRFKKDISTDEAHKVGLQLVQFMAYVFQLVGADFRYSKDHSQRKGRSSSRA